MEKNIPRLIIEKPKPLTKLKNNFVISGWIPASWVKNNDAFFIDLLDIDGNLFAGDGQNNINKNIYSKKYNAYRFTREILISYFGAGWVKQSEGGMVVQIKSASKQYFLPVIIKNFYNKKNKKIIKEKLSNVEKTILQYQQDIKKYNKELEKIKNNRLSKLEFTNEHDYYNGIVGNQNFLYGINNIIEESDSLIKNYIFQEDDKNEERLRKKYKKALEWQEPFLGKSVGGLDGFNFIIFSNDHDKHFHVIHKGKGINAKFSFPEIKLIASDKYKNNIKSKEVEKIIEYFKQTENFDKLQEEFDKRSMRI